MRQSIIDFGDVDGTRDIHYTRMKPYTFVAFFVSKDDTPPTRVSWRLYEIGGDE
jgi:hypothetical protein